MTNWQMIICATALHCNHYSRQDIATALNIDENQAQRLMDAGAAAQASTAIGFMQSPPANPDQANIPIPAEGKATC